MRECLKFAVGQRQRDECKILFTVCFKVFACPHVPKGSFHGMHFYVTVNGPIRRHRHNFLWQKHSPLGFRVHDHIYQNPHCIMFRARISTRSPPIYLSSLMLRGTRCSTLPFCCFIFCLASKIWPSSSVSANGEIRKLSTLRLIIPVNMFTWLNIKVIKLYIPGCYAFLNILHTHSNSTVFQTKWKSYNNAVRDCPAVKWM